MHRPTVSAHGYCHSGGAGPLQYSAFPVCSVLTVTLDVFTLLTTLHRSQRQGLASKCTMEPGSASECTGAGRSYLLHWLSGDVLPIPTDAVSEVCGTTPAPARPADKGLC